MDVNFFGAAYPAYYALRDLIARKGLIAYVTSGSGHLPMAGYLGYSVRRQNDIKRHPASSVAKKSCEAIIDRRGELDLSPAIQKLATRARPFIPGPIDRLIYKRVSTLRSAFTSEVQEHQRASAA
jgi:hypothetical protein